MKGHHTHGRWWVVALAIALLIGAHVVLLGVASTLHYGWLLAGSAVGIAALKYGWWKLGR